MIAGATLSAPAIAASEDTPDRIVSINLCTDQIVLALDPGKRLVAVSNLARDPDLSVMWERALDVQQVPASLEPIVALKPDIVLAGTFGHARLVAQLGALGIEVMRVPEAAQLRDIAATYLHVGERLGLDDKAGELAAAVASTLSTPNNGTDRSALMLSPGLLVHTRQMLGGAVLHHAGFANASAGDVYISLERIVASPPDVLFVAEREGAAPSRSGQLFRHPAMRRATFVRRISPATLICGTLDTAVLAQELASWDVSGQERVSP